MDLVYWFLGALDFWSFSFWTPVVVLAVFALMSGLLLRAFRR